MLWAYEQSCDFSFGILSNIPLFNFKRVHVDKMLTSIKAPPDENPALPHLPQLMLTFASSANMQLLRLMNTLNNTHKKTSISVPPP